MKIKNKLFYLHGSLEKLRPAEFKKYLQNLEYKLFLLGILFLASAPFLSSLLFIYPIVIGLVKNKRKLISDKYNYPLIVASFIIIIKSVIDMYYPALNNKSWDPSLNWIGLINWIPLFLCYFGFQPYLASFNQRLLVSKFFIASTIPILFSGIIQYFFKIYGPFKTLNGLIIWYQRPIDFETGSGLTSVFSNPNYTGTWLTLIWPFCLSFLLINKRCKSNNKLFIIAILSLAFIVCAVLTNSRGAWISLILPIPLVLGRIALLWLIPLLLIIFSSILLTFIPVLNGDLQDFLRMLIPYKVWIKFSEVILNFSSLPRIKIWSNAILFISEKPILGWGASSFPILFYASTGLFRNHSHNLFMELSLNYGLVASISVFITIFLLFQNSLKEILRKKSFIEIINNKSWWAAALIFFTSHIYDITYYDLRISIASWIFLAGLRCISYP